MQSSGKLPRERKFRFIKLVSFHLRDSFKTNFYVSTLLSFRFRKLIISITCDDICVTNSWGNGDRRSGAYNLWLSTPIPITRSGTQSLVNQMGKFNRKWLYVGADLLSSSKVGCTTIIFQSTKKSDGILYYIPWVRNPIVSLLIDFFIFRKQNFSDSKLINKFRIRTQ